MMGRGAAALIGRGYYRCTSGERPPKIRGNANLAGAWSAQPVPASPPRATHRPAAARAPRTTPGWPGCTCGHAAPRQQPLGGRKQVMRRSPSARCMHMYLLSDARAFLSFAEAGSFTRLRRVHPAALPSALLRSGCSLPSLARCYVCHPPATRLAHLHVTRTTVLCEGARHSAVCTHH